MALYNFLIEHATQFTEDWLKFQEVKEGSDYSSSAPPAVMNKIKEQNSNYVRLVAKSLLQTEAEMRETISNWTSQTAADRVQSKTSLNEVARNSGVFRRVYWDYIQKFTIQTDLSITVDDIFAWEKKLNTTLDYVFETFTTYFTDMLLKRLASQASLIKELSAPVIILTEHVGLLPIIGEIDTARAKSILESTLHQSVDAKISILIIDLSGVVIVDTMVAHQIFQLIDSLRMVGIRTTLTGIRPEVAQTAIQLGIDFSNITTESSLKNVVKKIMLAL